MINDLWLEDVKTEVFKKATTQESAPHCCCSWKNAHWVKLFPYIWKTRGLFYSTKCHGQKDLHISELVGLDNEAHLNICIRCSDNAANELKLFICAGEFLKRKIRHHSNNHVKDFESCQGWKVRIEQIQLRYNSNIPFLG